MIDADANPVTGDPDAVGGEYAFVVDDDTYWFAHWDGSDWVDMSDASVRVTGGPRGLMISVNRSELGNTSELRVHILEALVQTTPVAGPKAGKSLLLQGDAQGSPGRRHRHGRLHVAPAEERTREGVEGRTDRDVPGDDGQLPVHVHGPMTHLWAIRTTAATAVIAVAAIGAGAPARAAASPALEAPTVAFLAGPAPRFDSPATSAPRVSSLAQIGWRGRRFATGAGESVNVKVSPAYGSDPRLVQQWVDFFASLIHGPELGLLTAYIAPLDEVEELCRGDALGCYWSNRLVMVGDSSDGIPPASVAAHEYGHHVANNRLNPPWRAIDWGTKRWASYLNICARAALGTAFPGDEGSAYTLNPGEAFAETYRVLNETQSGLPLSWPIVDASFIPDATALQAVRDDVVQPWTAPATQTIRVRFGPHRRVWTRKLVTQLDGQLSAQIGGSSDLQLLGGGRSLAPARWTANGSKALQYQVCGRRSVEVRVTRYGGPPSLTLRLSLP